ncbi:MAG: response regulator [Oscillospiraceae bacterium]
MYQIMLVEDEALVRESMAQNTNWEKFGFAPPHVFENGRQAADHLETVLPDVVITDICMPFLDGLELAKLVYERFPETIVVVLTGFSEFSYAQKAIRYHVHDYLLKPVSPKEFDQLLENLSAELSRRENRQGLYSRAVMADEVLKDHFFQSLLQTDAPQELPASMREAGVGLGGRLHASRWRCRRRGRRHRGPGPARGGGLRARAVPPARRPARDADRERRRDRGAHGPDRRRGQAAAHAAAGGGRAYRHRHRRAYAGVDGLRTSAQEAQHALGYAFSTGETLLFDPSCARPPALCRPTTARQPRSSRARCSPAAATGRWS